ncbi:hypothetical protein [Deinococcus humi]|uniref:Uncharacterized protein n=1 Tax=Deinococcus humi TaxID=662880 RepID=A0A7W8NET7_9DEIO|nr:hypothetical protein [Deinococcus humi]MBB5362098.1 hypothetical protein [Deinococcus humi]GGO22077.1 hypothetical protein GCM10008949_08990 [Deinococcus humi]
MTTAHRCPSLPRPADLAACTTDAALLQLTGQGALPLLMVYQQSRRPRHLPCRILLGLGLRSLVSGDLLDNARIHIKGDPPPVMRVLRTALPEATLEFWPPARRRRRRTV